MAVYDTSDLRTLPFGRAVLLYRSIPPIDLALRAWMERKDGKQLAADRQLIEGLLAGRPAIPR